jgi:serine/threonine protein kinase/tetratricopeptide (TPR) repeat protein
MGIHDLGAEQDESGNDLHYLAMEYIEGESLTDFLADKSHQLKDLMRIAEKIAVGLASAHKLNIVHRDIKTDNIIIDEEGDPKILDFGLAKPVAGAIETTEDTGTVSISAELTEEGKILGTVSYMSPEQARGEEVDSRSDIFSFGILMYKLFTGQPPFEGTDKVSTIAKILESPHEPIRRKNETLPAELERIIDKCLQKNPNDRYQNTRDLALDIRSLRRQFESGISDSDSTIQSLGGAPSKKSKSWMPLIGVGAIVLVIAVVLITQFVNKDSSVTMAQEQPLFHQDALAILSFENKTNDTTLNWMISGIPELIVTDLSQSSQDIISRSRLISSLPNPPEDPSEIPDRNKVVKMASQMGATKILSGSFFKSGDMLRIDARLEDINTGRIILGEKVMGSDFFLLADSLTQKIAASLNIQEMMSSDKKVTSFVSSNREAYKHYVKGLEKFDKGLYDESIEDFENAIEIDSSFALPYMRIGMVHTFKGRNQQGQKYLVLAEERSENLPVKERMLIDIYTDLWVHTKIDDAYVKIQSYVKNYPDDWEGRFFYAVFLYQIGEKFDMALAQIDTMLMINPRDRWGLSLAATIHAKQKDFTKAIEKTKLSKTYYPDSPQPYLELSGYYREIREFEKALNEIDQLLQFDPDNNIAIRIAARLYILMRDFEKARETAELLKKHHSDDPFILTGYEDLMVDIETWQGDFLDAVDHYHKYIEHAQKTKDPNIMFSAHSSLSQHYLYLNNSDSALKYAKTAHEYAYVFNNFTYAFTLIEIDTKNCPEAERIFNEGITAFRERMPEDIWPVADQLEKIFEGSCNHDTLQIINAFKAVMDMPINQGLVDNLFAVGRFSVEYGNYEEGAEYLKRITSGDMETTGPFTYLQSMYYIGVAEHELGNYAEARRYFEEMLKYWGDPQLETKKIKDARKRLKQLPS